MKKRVLLALLPAAMMLTACAGAGQKANDKNLLFKEDTLAHEELFEQKGFGRIHKLSHLDSSLPAIGVQKSDVKEITVSGTPTNVVSIRFVAAVNLDSEHLADAHPVWTRVLYEEDGDGVLKGVDTLESTKAYTKINDGGSGTLPSAFGEYNYFVTYTMTNIPVAYNSCYFNVSLSLGGVSSRVLATTVDLSSHFSFKADSENFFLTGTVKGVANDVAQDSPTRDSTNNAASFTADFDAGDSFKVVQKTNTIFKIWNGTNLQDEGSGFAKAGDISVSTATRYCVFLNKTDQIYHAQYRLEKTPYYVRGTAAGGWDVTEESAYRMVTDSDNKGILLEAKLTKDGEFKIGGITWSVYDLGADRLLGGAKDLGYVSGTSGNIVCNRTAYYNLFLTNNDYISIEWVRDA